MHLPAELALRAAQRLSLASAWHVRLSRNEDWRSFAAADATESNTCLLGQLPLELCSAIGDWLRDLPQPALVEQFTLEGWYGE
eukprot:SAG11_NODE_21803_length_418_cov_1.210031_1_plen_82_part_10